MIIKSRKFLSFLQCFNGFLILMRTNVSVNSSWIRPRENFFERANPCHPGIFSLPRGRNDSRIPGAKFSQTRRNCSLSLQKILKGQLQNKLFYSLFYAISAKWCVLTKIQLQNLAIIAYFDFYSSLSIVIVVTVISIFSANLKESLMIYICGKF